MFPCLNGENSAGNGVCSAVNYLSGGNHRDCKTQQVAVWSHSASTGGGRPFPSQSDLGSHGRRFRCAELSDSTAYRSPRAGERAILISDNTLEYGCDIPDSTLLEGLYPQTMERVWSASRKCDSERKLFAFAGSIPRQIMTYPQAFRPRSGYQHKSNVLSESLGRVINQISSCYRILSTGHDSLYSSGLRRKAAH